MISGRFPNSSVQSWALSCAIRVSNPVTELLLELSQAIFERAEFGGGDHVEKSKDRNFKMTERAYRSGDRRVRSARFEQGPIPFGPPPRVATAASGRAADRLADSTCY
jgi:hypothetical protein